MSMFVSIINAGFEYVREHDDHQPTDEQATVRYMLHRFERWLGPYSSTLISANTTHLVTCRYWFQRSHTSRSPNEFLLRQTD
jgi:hypothetical protein